MKNKLFTTTIYLTLFFLFYTINCSAQTNKNSQKNKIDELVKTFSEYGEFNGTILVAKNGELVYNKGIGFANMEFEVPNQTDTKFRIASITKQFTAMLVLQLVSEKKLELHTPISNYLPDYPSENADIITLHHLLTHSSGIPNSSESPKPKVDNPDMTIPDNYNPIDLVNTCSNLELEFPPGEKFSYSNSGYTLLGHIVEKVSGKPYSEVLKEKILDPLGMKNTGVAQYRKITKNRAKGYFKNWGEYYNANYIDMSKVYSSGYIYSSSEDMFIWDKALYSERLLQKEYSDLMFTPHIQDPDYGAYYGYGWSIKDLPVGNSDKYVQTIMHDGVIDGFCALFVRIPESKSTIILLSNIRRAPLNSMTKAIMGILYDEPYSFPKQSLAYSTLGVIDDTGINDGAKHFELYKDDSAYYLSEQEMNIISYKLMQSDRADAAVTVLEMGIAQFPEAFNLYDSLGEVLMNLGKNKDAIKSYKKSLELNPMNKNGIKMLEQLSVKLDKQ